MRIVRGAVIAVGPSVAVAIAVVAVGNAITVPVTIAARDAPVFRTLAVPAAALEGPAPVARFPAARVPVVAVTLALPVAADPVMAAVAPLPETGRPDEPGARRGNHLVARRRRGDIEGDADIRGCRHPGHAPWWGHPPADQQVWVFPWRPPREQSERPSRI